jgi:hypothetical protein
MLIVKREKSNVEVSRPYVSRLFTTQQIALVRVSRTIIGASFLFKLTAMVEAPARAVRRGRHMPEGIAHMKQSKREPE